MKVQADGHFEYLSIRVGKLKRFAQISSVVLAIASLFVSLPIQASTSYCGNSLVRDFIRAKFRSVDRARLEGVAAAQVELSTMELNSARVFDRTQGHAKSIGFNFQYTIVDLKSIVAMTNGHLHNWNFPVDGRVVNTDSELFYHIAPTLSVSSNALKNPELIGGNSLQLNTGLVYKKNISARSAWLLGARSDHRFGSYKAYPVAGVCIQPARDWFLQLALPDFSILKKFNRGVNLKLFVEPAGNQWHVFSKDKTRDSDFIYSAIVIGLSAQWRFSESMNASLVVEKHSNRRLEFVLDDNTVVDLKAESSLGLMLKGEVLF